MHQHPEATKGVDGKFHCSQCSAALSSAKSLRRHLLVHSDTRPFPCPDCPKEFREHYKMLHHRQASHADTAKASPSYPCESCELHFSTTNERLQHYRRVHQGLAAPDPTTGPPPAANGGGAATAADERISILDAKKVAEAPAVVIGGGSSGAVKDFSCRYCTKVYTRQANLTYHLRLQHPDMAPKKKRGRKPNKSKPTSPLM